MLSSRPGVLPVRQHAPVALGRMVAPHLPLRHQGFPTAWPAEALEGSPEREMGKETQSVWRRAEGLNYLCSHSGRWKAQPPQSTHQTLGPSLAECWNAKITEPRSLLPGWWSKADSGSELGKELWREPPRHACVLDEEAAGLERGILIRNRNPLEVR